LRAKLDDANAELADMRRSAEQKISEFHKVAGLSRCEVAFIACLVKLGRATKEQLLDACAPDAAIKVVDVRVSGVRKKLRPHGIEIATIWGVGYEMTPDNIARLRALAAQEVAA
jgi:DNA-binding response OmpR family regulator